MGLLIKMLIQYFESNDLPTAFFHKLLSDLNYRFINRETVTVALKSYLFALKEYNQILHEDYNSMIAQIDNYNNLRLSRTEISNDDLINLE